MENIKSKIVKEYLARFPDTPSQTIAKAIYKNHSETFMSLDACRASIRYYRGQHGIHSRRSLTDKTHVKPPGRVDPFPHIPQPRVEMPGWDAYQVTGNKTVLVLGDLHAPFFDRNALVAALECGKSHHADMVLLNGDFWDCYSVSSFVTNPADRDLPNEIRQCRAVLGAIRKTLSSAEIVYKIGNHEERWERYLSVKAPELLGVVDFQIWKLLRFEEYGVTEVSDKRPIRLNSLNVLHGHEYSFSISNPVNPARGLYLKAKVHALCSHFHQNSQHSDTTLEGKVVSCWSCGSLCNLRPRYRPINNWNHGCAIVSLTESDFSVKNFRIINGKIYE